MTVCSNIVLEHSNIGAVVYSHQYGDLFFFSLKMEKAYNLLGEMKEAGVQPNTHCFNPIIMGYGTQVIILLTSTLIATFGTKNISPEKAGENVHIIVSERRCHFLLNFWKLVRWTGPWQCWVLNNLNLKYLCTFKIKIFGNYGFHLHVAQTVFFLTSAWGTTGKVRQGIGCTK